MVQFTEHKMGLASWLSLQEWVWQQGVYALQFLAGEGDAFKRCWQCWFPSCSVPGNPSSLSQDMSCGTYSLQQAGWATEGWAKACHMVLFLPWLGVWGRHCTSWHTINFLLLDAAWSLAFINLKERIIHNLRSKNRALRILHGGSGQLYQEAIVVFLTLTAVSPSGPRSPNHCYYCTITIVQTYRIPLTKDLIIFK